MAITSDFTNIATTTRASKAWDPGAWDFVSGSAVGALVEYAANAPRITSSGLLVEETSTNEIRNPRAEGATVGTIGSGGAFPANWSHAAGGMTWVIDEVGTEDGWDFIQITLSGTATGDARLEFESSGTITAANADDWTTSFGFKTVSGSSPGTDRIGMIERDGVSAITQINLSNITVSTTHERHFYSVTLGGTGTATVIPSYFIDNPTGTAAHTFRIYIPQTEGGSGAAAKAYPTSPVLPTAGAPNTSTRSFDYVTVAGGSWKTDTAYSLYIDALARGNAAGGLLYIGDGTATHRMSLICAAANDGVRLYASDGDNGGVQVDMSTAQVSKSGLGEYQVAIGMEQDNFALSQSGKTALTDTSGTIPNSSEMVICNDWRQLTAQQDNGYIRDIRYWPRRLTNAELEALVGN